MKRKSGVCSLVFVVLSTSLLPGNGILYGQGQVIDGKEMVASPGSGDDITFARMAAPMDTRATKVRSPSGAFKAARAKGAVHQGVDIILAEEERMCLASDAHLPPQAFEVYAVADGKVAYARLNTGETGAFDSGLGFTVIIDHGKDLYSLYAHLAQDPSINKCLPDSIVKAGGSLTVAVGAQVKAGQRIGFVGRVPRAASAGSPNFDRYDGPSGNALRTEQPIMVHIEFFQAPSGRKFSEGISSVVAKEQRGQLDPTPFLKKVGYR